MREKDLTEVKDKKKDKDKEKKEKKEKTKEKEKKDKKSKQSSVNEEILELGGKSINIPFSHTHTHSFVQLFASIIFFIVLGTLRCAAHIRCIIGIVGST